MTLSLVHESPAAPVGSFTLAQGCALTLTPPAASMLRVKQGRVWATLSGDRSDHVLVPGSALRIPAGAQVVIEPWALRGQAAHVPVFFDWDPQPIYVPAPTPQLSVLPLRALGASATRVREGAAVAQALRDLVSALALAVGAAARLAAGAGRIAISFAAKPILFVLT